MHFKSHKFIGFTSFVIISILYTTLLLSQGTLDVTFRYVRKPTDVLVRVFVPGTMPPGTSLDWGPNNNGFISPSAPSIMTFDSNVDAYVRTYTLNINSTYEYKIHGHFNSSGSSWQWISDPLNPETTGSNQNSVITVTDPFLFQTAFHENFTNEIIGISTGIFTNHTINQLTYSVGTDTMDGTANIDSNGVFYVPLNPPKDPLAGYSIKVTIHGQEYTILDLPSEQVVIEDRPQDTRLGANVTANGAVFVIHAPGQSVVKVLVRPSGSLPDISNAILMKKAEGEEDIWWLDMELVPGEYEYEYVLATGGRVPDPLSRRVRNNKSVIEIGSGGVTTADDYSWQSDSYIRPALDTLVIYEMHVDDFSAQGSSRGRFTHVINKLDYLKDLGINALEIMPIMEFPGSRSWGYNTEYFAAVEATYGTPEDFKRLVDEAHLRGIAIILDIVWNHMDGNGPLWRIQPDYSLNPYFKTENDVRPNETIISFGGRLLDHFTEETQCFVNEVHRIWIEEYRIDGFRFDFTRGVGWTHAQPQFGILGWSTTLRQLDSTAYQIAEHLPADPNLINTSDLDAGWHDSFHDRLLNDIHKNPQPTMPTFERQVLGLREYNNNGALYNKRTAAVKATVTHDEQSFIQEMVQWKSVPLETALLRDLTYSTFTFTSLGIPMLWQAQEVGMQSGWLDTNGNGNWDEEKLAYRPFDWSLLNTERGQRHLDVYKRLILLRKRNPALYRGNLFVLYRNSSLRLSAYGYRDEAVGGEGDEVMVVANLGSNERTISNLIWMSTGTWQNVLDDGDTFVVTKDTLDSYTISGYTARVFEKQTTTSVADNEELPRTFGLFQNYPNPFNPSTTIQYEIEQPGKVTLQLFDLLGRKIRILVNEFKQPGNYIVQWDGLDEVGIESASGVYVGVLSSGDITQTIKLVKLK